MQQQHKVIMKITNILPPPHSSLLSRHYHLCERNSRRATRLGWKLTLRIMLEVPPMIFSISASECDAGAGKALWNPFLIGMPCKCHKIIEETKDGILVSTLLWTSRGTREEKHLMQYCLQVTYCTNTRHTELS